MKKNLFSALMCFMTLSVSAQSISSQYVDLGLPSGTKWKSTNEDGVYTYLSAKYYFGDALPNSAQFDELLYNCTWRWTGKGFRVTGPNNNYIFFPFDGYADCDENMHNVGVSSFLWTINGAGSNWAYGCWLSDSQKDILENDNCIGGSVRLVLNE